MNKLQILKLLINMYNDSYYGIEFIKHTLDHSDQLSFNQLQRAYEYGFTQYKQWFEKHYAWSYLYEKKLNNFTSYKKFIWIH